MTATNTFLNQNKNNMTTKFKYFIWLLICLIHVQTAFSQQNNTLERIPIGSQVPDFTFKHLINMPKDSVNLNSFKGKVLILDFWDSYCLSCIQSWPKLLKLQEKYKDKLQILLINTREDEQKIKALLKKRDQNFDHKMDLPIAFGDKELDAFFPHQSIPHVVWIDADGKVKYISGGDYLGEETLENMINRKDQEIPEKTDTYLDVKWSKPLFMKGNGGNGEHAVYTSVLSKYTPGLTATAIFNHKKDHSYGVLSNGSVKDMVRFLYGTGRSDDGTLLSKRVPSSRVVFQTDSADYVPYINGIRQQKNVYTLQITAGQDIPIEKMKAMMIADLLRNFQLKVTWEKQRKMCLVISQSNTPIKVYESGEKLAGIQDFKIGLNAVTIQEFTETLININNFYYNLPYPIVNETNFEGKLGSIAVETNITDINKLSKALNKYGMRLSIAERETDVLVISADQ